MKKTKFRRLAVMTASLLCCLIFTVPAYAQSNEPQPEATPAPVETEAEPETQNPFTPDGTGTVVDNATDEDGKEFYTITTADESVFYLVIDKQKTSENVYENKKQSDANTSGHVGPKIRVWGEPQQAASGPLWPRRHCLPFSDTPENDAKKQRLLLANLRFSGFLEPFGCGLHDNKLFFVHGV